MSQDPSTLDAAMHDALRLLFEYSWISAPALMDTSTACKRGSVPLIMAVLVFLHRLKLIIVEPVEGWIIPEPTYLCPVGHDASAELMELRRLSQGDVAKAMEIIRERKN